MNRITSNWTWTLTSQNFPVYPTYVPLRPKFWSVSLNDYPFPRYNLNKVGENQKYTEWPQTQLEHLTGKIVLYTLNTYPRDEHFVSFHSTTSHFRDTRSLKMGNGKCTQWTQLEHLIVKITLYTLNTCTYPCGQNFGPFRSTTSGFQDHIARFIIPHWLPRWTPKKHKKLSKIKKIWNFTF